MLLPLSAERAGGEGPHTGHSLPLASSAHSPLLFLPISYTVIDRIAESSRIGNCAPIVIYGWRYPARSVPALYTSAGAYACQCCGLAMPPVEAWAQGLQP